MKTRKMVVEVICIILLLNFFYEGLYKLFDLHGYGLYITRAPFLKGVGSLLKYIIPFGEIGLAALLVIPGYRRKALYLAMGGFILYVIWIMGVILFTNYLFTAYHPQWDKQTWMQKMLISMGFCWMAFIAVILATPGDTLKMKKSNLLRNVPANVSR